MATSAILTLGATPAWQRTMVFDQFSLDAVNRSAEVFDYASGKSINAARVLRTLGAALSRQGSRVASAGNCCARIWMASESIMIFSKFPRHTRQCITVIDRHAQTATELVEESLPISSQEWSGLDQKVRALSASSKSLDFHRFAASGRTPGLLCAIPPAVGAARSESDRGRAGRIPSPGDSSMKGSS